MALDAPGPVLAALDLGEDVDLDEVRVEGELWGEGICGEFFLENEFGHDEAGIGDEVRVFVADDGVPDQGGVTVHAEGGQKGAGQAWGSFDTGKGVGAKQEGNGGVATGLLFLWQAKVFLNDGHSKRMGGTAVLVELEGFPFFGIGGQTVPGARRQVDVPAGTIGDVVEELFEDQFLQIVL